MFSGTEKRDPNKYVRIAAGAFLARLSYASGVAHAATLADPRYNGKWTQPPWTSHWDIAPLVFPDFNREKWLEIIRRAGKNAAAVQPEQGGSID